MPLANPADNPVRKDPAYRPAEIAALVAYVGIARRRARRSPTSTSPPATSPWAASCSGRTARPATARPARRRAELRPGRAVALAGDPHAGRRGGPHRTGPDAGVRARDALDAAGRLDRARTSSTSRTPTTGAASPLGRLGPIPEGFVVWVLGIGLLLVIVHVDRRPEPEPPRRRRDRGGHRVSDDPPRRRRHRRGPDRCSPAGASGSPPLAFGVSIVGALALAVVYWRAASPSSRALFLALALGGLGVGLVVWARYFMPTTRSTRSGTRSRRPRRRSTAFREEFERGEHILTRRSLLVRMGTARPSPRSASRSLFPIRSLGPRPGKGFKSTPFRARRPAGHADDGAGPAPTTSRSTACSPSSPRATPTPPTRRRC